MKIRKALIEDKLKVKDLTKKFTKSKIIEKDFNSIFNDLINNKNVSFLVAESDTNILGYCLAFHYKTLYANGFVSWIQEIIIDEKFREKGLGSKLLKEIEIESKNKGSKVISLATVEAIGFYKKNNYTESGLYFKKKL